MSAAFADWTPLDHPETFETGLVLAGATSAFNHFSNESQSCIGRSLALMLAKGVIATLLCEGRYRLERPKLNPAHLVPKMFNYFRVCFLRTDV